MTIHNLKVSTECFEKIRKNKEYVAWEDQGFKELEILVFTDKDKNRQLSRKIVYIIPGKEFRLRDQVICGLTSING